MGKKKRSPGLSQETPEPAEEPGFPIVGIGASAGGLEPVTALLRSLSADVAAAFVLIQHLDPHHDSALCSILGKATSLKVTEAGDGLIVRPNEVYVIAPATEMVLENGRLRVTPRPVTRSPQMPIDTFLISLAAECGSRSVGVILSGTGTDGTRGMQAIHSAGGLTFAQDATATHDGMPRSVILAGCIDFVLPPEGIAAKLSLKRSERDPSLSPAIDATTNADDTYFEKILRLLHKSSGIDFVNYKVPTLRRRIERRMTIQRISTLKSYLECLLSDPAELSSLEEEVLIHVTSFFRDPDTFEALKANVLPQVIASKSSDTDVRIWVPGCSSGEEVYSIVITVIEFLEAQHLAIPIKVFATDVSERAIEKARAGLYPLSIAADVSPQRLQRFFKKSEAGYQVEKTVRDVCVFARQDITQDPPFSQIDLISCRNVLIYLGPVLHSRVFPIFHYALRPEGFLFLGNAESVGGFAELFEPFDKLRRFYQRRKTAHRIAFNFATGITPRPGLFSAATPLDPLLRGHDVRDEADRVVLSRYAPAGVVVDESWNVVQFRGQTGRFLEPAPGLPSYDLLQMARQGILPALRKALETAKHNNLPADQDDVDCGDSKITLEVIPITVPSTGLRYFVVLFVEPPESHEMLAVVRPLMAKTVGTQSKQDQELARLKNELAATKAYLQSVIEAKDVTNEELRAANEEVISSNEELQSTNEELETAKEELQSTNEELETVNEELESRILTTIQLNDELTNLITCVRIPIVIIGPDMRVRRFSPRAREVFNLLPGDLGRLITDLTLRINVPDLRSLITNVIETLEFYEREVTDLNGHWYSLSIRPLRTTDNKIDGAIILLLDINAIKEREQLVIEARDVARNIIETLHESLLVLDDNLRVQTANRAFYETFKTTSDSLENRLIFSVNDGIWDFAELRSLLDKALRSDGGLLEIEIEREFSGIGKRVMRLNARRMKNRSVEPLTHSVLLAIEDITAREDAIRSMKNTEVLMQAVVEKAVNAIITISEAGLIQTFNRAAEVMFGYEAADVMGKNVRMLMPNPYRDEHDGYLKQYLETGRKHIIGSGRVIMGLRKDGTTFPAELGVSEIDSVEGRLFTGILVDISERRALEREVLAIASYEQQRIGQDLHDTAGQELTGMSYLAQSLAETLAAKALPEADKAARLAAGLGSALQQLRGIAKGLIPVEIDSQGLMAALDNLAKQTTELSSVPCEFRCEHEVLLDDARIASQLFLIAREAVHNSVKHARALQIQLRLGLVNSSVELQVRDDGVGIDENARSNGVGLHIMAYRANAMGGTIHIQRNEDGGTLLICRIPLNNTNVTK